MRRGCVARWRDAPGSGRGVDGHRELDAAAELPGQRVGDEAAKPGLELFLDELVGGRDEGRVLDQPERSGQPQPGTLMGFDLEIGEFLEGPRPHLRQVRLAHRVFTSRPHMRINSLIHRLCTPHSAPCPDAAGPLCGWPAPPRPLGVARYPQPRRASRATFGKRPFLPTARMGASGCCGCRWFDRYSMMRVT